LLPFDLRKISAIKRFVAPAQIHEQSAPSLRIAFSLKSREQAGHIEWPTADLSINRSDGRSKWDCSRVQMFILSSKKDSSLMIEWNIQSRAHACQACTKAFADKEPFHTLLFDQRHGYDRLDVCEDCWKSQYSQGATDRKGFISYWQSVYAVPPAAPPEAIQKDTAETLLRKLVERNEPEHAAARYILAVMLERKRILKVKAQCSEDGQRVFIYEYPKTGDLFNIADPNLQLDQLEEVQRDVAHLLEHGLDPLPANEAPIAGPAENSAETTNQEANPALSPAQATDPTNAHEKSEPSPAS
jgi:hypothetical protein